MGVSVVVTPACGPTGARVTAVHGVFLGDVMRFFFFSSRRRHTRLQGDWSSDVCSSDLQLEHIPLYQIHQPNPVVPDSVIMPGMRDLLDSGAIGAAGVSNYSLSRWEQAEDRKSVV